MTEITREQFGSAVAAAVSSVSKADGRFHLARHMLRRIPRAVARGGNFSKDASIDTGAVAKIDIGKKKGDERRLYCQLLAPGDTIPLYDMDQPRAVQRLVDRMKSMWREANTSST